MTITYSGTAGATGATISITGSETLATLKTSLASNTSWALVDGSSIVFAATLSIGSGTTTGSFTGSDFTFIFPAAYTFTIPNNSAQSGSSTTLSDAAIIFDVTAKGYSVAVCYGTHTWTRVVYRSQITSGRTDLFQNTGCIFAFNNVQLTVSSTATSYPYDFIHVYNNTTTTLQGLTVTGLGGTGSGNSFEVGSAPGTTTTFQGLTLGGVFGVVTVNNNGTSYTGTQDFRALSWPLATNWAFNPGSGGAVLYITNPNKPSGWTQYSFLTGGAGGTGNLTERYTHDITTVNSSAAGVVGVSLGDFRSGAFVWTATSGTGGVMTEQYVTTATLIGTAPGTLTSYSTSVTTAAWFYGYNTFVGGRTFTPAGLGITDTILMVADVTTLSSSAVAALTSLATLDNLYDASRYWNTLNSTNIQIPSLGTNIITYSGTQLNLGSYNLVINSGTTSAGNAFSVSGSTITIYATALAAGTKFTSFTTTGTVTINSGSTVTSAYTCSSGTQGILTLTNIVAGSSIYVATSGGTQLAYVASSGTSYTIDIPPNSGSNYIWKVAQYGYLPVTSTFNPQAVSSTQVVQLTDPFITQSNATTVSGYASLSSPDQIYDYAAYYETTSTGIMSTRLDSANGKVLSFGSSTVVFNTAATSVYAISGTTATVKTASTFTNGSTFSSGFSTTGTFTNTGSTTTIQCLYVTSVGTSLAMNLTTPIGSSVVILNGSGTQQQYTAGSANTTGTVTYYAAPGQTGTWSYRVAQYKYLSSATTFTPSGQITNIVTLVGDSGITNTNVTAVAAYTALTTCDQLYDYSAYWQTTNGTGGIFVPNLITKNGSAISFAGMALTFNNSSSSTPLAITVSGGAMTAATIQTGASAVFATGVTFTSFATTSTTTLTSTAITCVYTNSSGTATVLNVSNLPYTSSNGGSYLSILNNSGTQVQYIGPITSGTQAVYIAPGSSVTYNCKVACYGYISATYPFTTQGYDIITASLATDTGITQTTKATVAAYTALSTCDQFYDYNAYWQTTNNTGGILVSNLVTKNGTGISCAGLALTFNNSTGTPLAVTVTSGAMTAQTIQTGGTFATGSTFTSFSTTSTTTLTSTTVTCVYSNSTGTSTVLTLSNLPYNSGTNGGSYISISNNSGTQVQYIGPVTTGSQVVYIAPAASSSYTWKVAAYGYISQTSSFTTQGYVTGTASLSSDTGITQTSRATVAAYTSLATCDQFYDYCAYWQTTNNTGGIAVPNLVTKNATAVSCSSLALTFNNLTGTPLAVTVTSGAMTALVVQTGGTFAAGTTFNSFATSSTTTLTSTTVTCVYTNSSGTSTVLTLSNLPYNASNGGSYISLITNTGSQAQYLGPVTSGSQIIYIAPGAALSYSWKVACYGYISQTTAFTTQGYVTGTASLGTDTGITQSARATVAGYNTLTTCDQLYDYNAYWQTTNNTGGITVSNLVTKSGTTVSCAGLALTLNNNTTTPLTVTVTSGAMTALTIATGGTFATGVTFTSFSTTSTTTLTSITVTCVYTNSSGTSTVLSVTNLPYTSSNGGTYLSLINNSSAQVQYVGPITSGSTTLYIAPGAALAYSLKAACYGYISGTSAFTTQGYVSIASSLGTDTGISQTSRATVAAYTTLSTCDKFYDYNAYWQTTNNTGGITVANPATKNGTQVTVGANALVMAASGSAYAYNGTTITINATSTFSTGTTFTSFATTSTVTNLSTAITCVYTTSSGTSTVVTFTGLPSASSVSIANNSGTQVQYIASATSPQVVYVAPAATATYSWKVANYGSIAGTGSFTLQGYVSIIVSLASDTGITQASKSTVAAYTTVTSPDQIYDYLAYWETTNNTGGIQVTRPATKNGTVVALGTANLVLNGSASPVYTFASGSPNTLTFNSGTIATGVTFAQFSTSGTVTLSNGAAVSCIYTSNLGTSSALILSGLVAGSVVYIQNASAAQVVYTTGQSGTYTYAQAPGASAGTWTWCTKALGYSHVKGTFIPSNGGNFLAAATGALKLDPDGTTAYQGTTSPYVSTSFSGLSEADILIGNGQITVQNAFDASEQGLVTAPGMAWLASGLSDCQQYNSFNGNDLFLSHLWRLKALNTSSANATLLGIPVSADNVPINPVNGNIIIQSNTTAQQLSTALWSTSTTQQAAGDGTFGGLLETVSNQTKLIPGLF